MASALAGIWPESFTRASKVWGKDVVLRGLSNVEIEEINDLVALAAPARADQEMAVLTVAHSVVTIDGVGFTDVDSGEPLSLEAAAAEVRTWLDPLTAALYAKCVDVSKAMLLAIAGVVDPNSSARPAPSTTP